MNPGFVDENGARGNVRIVISRMNQELQALEQQRNEVTRRIGTVKRTVGSLVRFFGETAVPAELSELLGTRSPRRPGLSAECRAVLMQAERPLSAREVRDSVLSRLPALANHKDSLASVTTILNRLMRYGEACNVPDESGRQRWTWATDHEAKYGSANQPKSDFGEYSGDDNGFLHS